MTFFVRRCIVLFMIAECVIFFVVYCFGPKGLKNLHDAQNAQVQTRQDIVLLQQEIKDLERDIAIGKTDFAKEKIAREQLLMKRNDEMVYFKTL